MSEKPVVLVTGASRGIGKAIALAFAEKKYRVAVNYFSGENAAESAAEEIRRRGGEAMLCRADVGHSARVRPMVESILQSWGRLDVLVNNAGVTYDCTILKMTDEVWNDVIRVNLSGAFWCLRECAKVMSKQGGGAIVNVGSIIGLRGNVGSANYGASKAGLINLTKTAARELGRFDVRVNAVLPGFHLTDMGSAAGAEVIERVRAEHVLGRFPDLGELADLVVFLAEQKSASGQVYAFDSRVL